MNRLALVAVMCLPWLLCGQERISSFTVAADHPAARFKVDGQEYRGSATFLWPEGSKHILQFEVRQDGYQYDESESTRFAFSGWTDAGGKLAPTGSTVQTVTAHPSAPSYRLIVSVEHRIRLVMFEHEVAGGAPGCDAAPLDPGNALRPGVAYVAGSCYWRNTDVWLPPGRVNVNALPYPGFVFLGWQVNGSQPSAFLGDFELLGPVTLAPRFAPGKRVKFLTDPPGLQVLIDRTPTPTPELAPCEANLFLPPAAPRSIVPLCVGEFDWALDSKHVIGAPSPQTDRTGRTWVFSSWSNGAGQNALYQVASLSPSETLTARFVRGAHVSFLTNPTGLKLSIDGRDNWPSYNFVWGIGSKYQVSAPAEQTDARGRRYVFRGWSNGGAAAQEVIVPEGAATNGLRLIANYELLSQVTIQSSPGGTAVEVDGSVCATPCTVDRTAGAEIRIAAPALRTLSEAHRLEFVSWSDGAARERTFTLTGTEARTITASYRTAYRLQATSDPAGGSRFQFEPNSADLFYTDGTTVVVTANPEPGFRFRRWAGDLEGTYRSAPVVMSIPRSVRALLDRVPHISPAGVRNAAGETPEAVVAPGSIITVYGANLAPFYEVGPANPLAQALAGVTVSVGDRLLPLLFVSPEQINALLPSDLEEGVYSLKVSCSGQPDVKGDFTTARNAPGLFRQAFEGKLFALATHADGSPVGPNSPAKRGELVTLYGTGFGPYERPAPDGFALPESPRFKLADGVEIQAGSARPATVWAGGAVGYTGVNVVQFRVTDELPRASTVEFKVRIGGRESNVVLLPLE